MIFTYILSLQGVKKFSKSGLSVLFLTQYLAVDWINQVQQPG